MKCQVTSNTTRKVMISREVKVPSYKEICGGEKTIVHLGYNNYHSMLKVEDNMLLQYPRKRALMGVASQISPDWEIFRKFFSLYNIEPIWLDCQGVYGHYDKKQGAWSGCMGKV